MLDKSKPYAQVYGDSPARFEQGGIYYDAQGKEINAKVKESDLDEEGRKDDVDLESLDWREIKKMVIDAGGEWDNKADGITFLRSK